MNMMALACAEDQVRPRTSRQAAPQRGPRGPDILDATVNDPAFRLDFPLAAGALLFIDNHKLAHDHESWLDDS